jgi:diguanylate cyclase (GGDEF)-like protein
MSLSLASSTPVGPDTRHQEPDRASLFRSVSFVPYLSAVRQGLILVDRRGRILLCTQPARLLLCLSEADLERGPARNLIGVLRSSHRHNSDLRLKPVLDGIRNRSRQCIEINVRERALQIELHPVSAAGWAVVVEDVSERREAEARVAEGARLDSLTGLPNRLFLHEALNTALVQLQRTGQPFAVLIIDLDRFKPVNDTLGHPIGDALLKTVADRIRSVLSPADIVARIGGDEFVVLQKAPRDLAATQALTRRIVDLVGRTYMVEGHLLTIGASVGVALAPADGQDADRLLKSADLALYRAKLDGRATFRFFEPEMDERMQARRALELDMRQALARREFQLHYQPQVSLAAGQIIGCEALVRWQHPERGTVAPGDFIPLAEEIGLIIPIGEWVVRQACRDAMTWAEPLSVAVNLSPAQFKSGRLVEMVMSALATSGLPPHRLELEITEGVLLQENETTLRTLHRLRELGVRVSMDDFGTGYSSLSYLRSFPFDKIKIDRSFVRDLAEKPDGDAIIRAIAGLGKSLGMTTVAEGVETPAQLERIRAEGCTDVQGYLISHPLPMAQLVPFLESYKQQSVSR